jgi:lipoprotein-anchoring transpeptidase ErfK/SrfK
VALPARRGGPAFDAKSGFLLTVQHLLAYYSLTRFQSRVLELPMLRAFVLAAAGFAIAVSGPVFSVPVLAEAVKAEPAPALGPSSTPATAVSPSGAQQAATETSEPVHTPPDATPPPPASAPSAAEPQPAAVPEKAVEAAKPAPPPPPTLTAAIDLAQQKITVSENGSAKYTWPISSGTAEFPTPRGTFRPQWTAKMWYSRKYDNAPMPHAVFINGGVAVHATFHTGSLGRPASHGCIRLAPSNAKTFYGLVQKHGLKMTKVSIYGTPKWRAPAIARRDSDRARRYAERDNNNSWGWGGPSYKTTSAYDPGFTKRRTRPAAPRAYANSNNYNNGYPPRVYRSASGQRYVLVQRPQRKVYYYNNSGYGW